MALTASDRLVGDIGLCLAADEARCEIGYTLNRTHHGRGLATQAVVLASGLAFAHTQARAMIAMTDVRNQPSIRLLERAGFQRTGSLTADLNADGEPVEWVYTLSR